MRDIKALLENKPSKAVWAMVNGLHKQSKRPDFTINMLVFGCFTPGTGVCFGCAATCALQEIAGVNLTSDTIYNREVRAKATGFYESEIDIFETLIDRLRRGRIDMLFDYFHIPYEDLKSKVGEEALKLPYLTTYNWQEGIQEYALFATMLEAAGY